MIALINFIYTGSITIDDQNVEKLQSRAEYLKLDEVKQFCDEFLREKVKLCDSFALFKVAASFSINEALKRENRKYVSTHLDNISQTDEFKTLSKDNFVACISYLERSLVEETSIYQAVITWVYHNEEARKPELPELLKMINLDEIDLHTEENTTSKKNLVATKLKCQNQAISTLDDLDITKQSESDLIQLEGKKEGKKVAVVNGVPRNMQTEEPKIENYGDRKDQKIPENNKDLQRKKKKRSSGKLDFKNYQEIFSKKRKKKKSFQQR